MHLFSNITPHIPDNGKVIIVIARTGEKLTTCVSVQNDAVKDPARNYIQPFALCGTPAELDENFEKEILSPIASSAGLQTSMREYEAAQEVAAANSKRKSDEKKNAADEARKTAAAQKTALDTAKALMDAGKWGEAARKYREILADSSLGLSDSQKAALNHSIEICESRDGGLFGGEGSDADPTGIEAMEAGAAGQTPVETDDPTEEDCNGEPDDDNNNEEE